MKKPTYRDLDTIFQALGFTSAQHFEDVLAHRVPSALESPAMFDRNTEERKRSWAERAIAIESEELERIRRTQAEQNAKRLQFRENCRHAYRTRQTKAAS